MFHKEDRVLERVRESVGKRKKQCGKKKERDKKIWSEEKAERELLERTSRRIAKANVKVLLETCSMLEEDKLLM